jgi:hypothetical protein
MLFLFFRVIDVWECERPRRIWQAVWNAVPNDRMQRVMLRDAARVRFTPPDDEDDEELWDIATKKENAAILDAIEWLVEKADHTGRKRDDAAHVPFVIDATKRPPQLVALDTFGHPIGRQLQGKDLIAEFKVYRERVSLLTEFAAKLDRHIFDRQQEPLPDKPKLPESPRPSGHKDETGKSP